MYCINCGTKLPDTAKFCLTCGTKIDCSPNINQNQSNNYGSNPAIYPARPVIDPIEFVIHGKTLQFDGSLRQYSIERLRFRNSFYPYLDEIKIISLQSFQKCIESDKDNALGIIADLGNKLISWTLDWGMNFLMQNGIYDISKEALTEKCDCHLDKFFDFYNQFEEGYLSIVASEEEMAEYRRLRHAHRSRWSGGGFGVSGALKGAAIAGVFNFGGTILSGIGTAISGVIDSSIISSKKKKYLTSRKWVNECCISLIEGTGLIFDETYRVFAKRKNITFPSIDFDAGKTYLANAQLTTDIDQTISIVLLGLKVNPFMTGFYRILYRNLHHLEYDLCKCTEYFMPKTFWNTLYSDIWQAFSQQYTYLSNLETEPIDSKIALVQQEIAFMETYKEKSEYIKGYASKYLEEYQRIFQADDLVRRTAKDGTILDTAENRIIYDTEQDAYTQIKVSLSSAKTLHEKIEILSDARKHGFRSKVICAEIENNYNSIASLLQSKDRVENLRKSLEEVGVEGINEVIKIAKQGDADAIFLLGELYSNGKYVKKDENTAFRLFTMASKLHHTEATAHLGHCYLTGSGVEEDVVKAYELLLETADKGSAFAQARLGILILSCDCSELGLPESQVNVDTGLRWLTMAAEQGDSEAQCLLARVFVQGEWVSTNYELALSWFEKAAKNNYSAAYCDLAAMFNQGLGVPKDSQKTITLLKKAEELDDDPEIKLALAQVYCDLERYHDAIKLFQICAESGCTIAFGKIAHMYQHGLGYNQNIDEAIKWFQAGAKRGDVFSQRTLGNLYFNGKQVPIDYLAAAKWFQMGAENGDSICQDFMGFLYEKGLGISQNYTEAIRWYQMGAENGYSNCQYRLGYLHMKGYGVPQDYTKAAYWFQRGAELDNHDCQYFLASLYENGNGVPKNYSMAAKWFQAGADAGDPYCQTRLGVLYYDGRGVERNYKIAAELYQKAIPKGDSTAMNNLALMYENGQGVPKDHKKALALLKDAIAAGNKHAPQNYKRIKRIFD